MRYNSIRFRLGKSEIRRLVESSSVQEMIVLGPSPQDGFLYALHATAAGAVSVNYLGNSLHVQVPQHEVAALAFTDMVGLSARISISPGTDLHVLIEKDFTCLDSRDGEDELDCYPNPQEAHADCRV